MLDLSFAARVKVDNAYEDLLKSHAFRHYKQPANSIDAMFDVLILRLYEHDGELVDERHIDNPSYFSRSEVPAQVPRKQAPTYHITSAGSPTNSNIYSASHVVASWPEQDRPDQANSFTLVDQYRPIFFDYDPTLFPKAQPGKKPYVALCLVYLPDPQKPQRTDWSVPMYTADEDLKNYMIQSKYAASLSLNPNPFTTVTYGGS